jgi:hypothetical protein
MVLNRSFATVADYRASTEVLLRAITASSVKRLTLYTPTQIGLLCGSLTTCRLRDRVFMEALANMLTNDKSARLAAFGGQELSLVALTFGTLDVVAPLLFTRIATRVEALLYEGTLKGQAVANLLFAYCLSHAPNGDHSLPVSLCTSLLRRAIDLHDDSKLNEESQAQLHICCVTMHIAGGGMKATVATINDTVRHRWLSAYQHQSEWPSECYPHVARVIQSLASSMDTSWPYQDAQYHYSDESTTSGYKIDIVLHPRNDMPPSSGGAGEGGDRDVRPIAIEIDGTRRHDRSFRYALAPTKLKRYLLPLLPSKWRVISISSMQWRSVDPSSQQSFIASLLDLPSPPPSTSTAPTTSPQMTGNVPASAVSLSSSSSIAPSLSSSSSSSSSPSSSSSLATSNTGAASNSNVTNSSNSDAVLTSLSSSTSPSP